MYICNRCRKCWKAADSMLGLVQNHFKPQSCQKISQKEHHHHIIHYHWFRMAPKLLNILQNEHAEKNIHAHREGTEPHMLFPFHLHNEFVLKTKYTCNQSNCAYQMGSQHCRPIKEGLGFEWQAWLILPTLFWVRLVFLEIEQTRDSLVSEP